MPNTTYQVFDCQLYVPARGYMRLVMPSESGPTKVARLEYLSYDELVDPGLRRLLAAFQTVPAPQAV